MAVKTVSSLAALEKLASIDWENLPTSRQALENYFSSGGVIRVAYSVEGNPSLLYPTRLRLMELVKEKQGLKENYERKQAVWKKSLRKAQRYFIENNVKKFSNPLYWKHITKCLHDKQYKSDAESVKLPVNLVADKRWQPMIRTFLEDPDYRAQLVETVSESIVYKQDRRVAKYADNIQNFRTEESSKNLKIVEKKIFLLDEEITALQDLMKWASQ